MKKIITLFALLAVVTLKAQDRNQMEQRVADMVLFTKTNQFEKLLDYSHPRIFTYATREEMLRLMKGMFNGDGFTISMMDIPSEFSFGEIKTFNGNHYALIHHNLGIKMIYDAPLPKDKIEERLNVFKAEMGTENVNYDPKQKALTAIKRVELIAVYGAETKNQWVFINNDGGIFIKSIVPQEVRQMLGAKE